MTIFYSRPILLSLIVIGLFAMPAAQATSSILIWPINPQISSKQKAVALWLENRGQRPVDLQIRVLAWQQAGFEDLLLPQKQIVGSPPMATLRPGKRQLVRLVSLQPAAPGTLQSYRVLVDEILPPNERPPELGVQFQMRYSVPLFVTGAGAYLDDGSNDAPQRGQALAPQLQYRIATSGGRRFVYIRNKGSAHARLSRTRLGQFELANGLFGYVLPGAEMRWQLPNAAPNGGPLHSRINEWKEPRDIQPY